MRSSEKLVMSVSYPVVLGKKRLKEVEDLEAEERRSWGEEETKWKYREYIRRIKALQNKCRINDK